MRKPFRLPKLSPPPIDMPAIPYNDVVQSDYYDRIEPLADAVARVRTWHPTYGVGALWLDLRDVRRLHWPESLSCANACSDIVSAIRDWTHFDGLPLLRALLRTLAEDGYDGPWADIADLPSLPGYSGVMDDERCSVIAVDSRGCQLIRDHRHELVVRKPRPPEPEMAAGMAP